MTTLASYISLNTKSFVVDNAQGFPINGIIKIGTEQIGYSSVDRALNVLTGLTRGVNGTVVSEHIPGASISMDLPAVLLLNGGRGYTEPPKVTAYIDPILYPAPTRPAVLTAVMNLDSVLRVDVVDPGQGYAVLPKIIIDSAIVVPFTSADVNLSSSTVQVYAPLLQTGDLVQYKVGVDSTAIGGLENNQWYYINVLETVPSVVIGFYYNYADCVNNHNRLSLYDQGTGTSHTVNLGARASAISSAMPVRENDIVLRFDRTTYNSQVIEWLSGRYYGAFYAGSYSNSESVASSSITLQSTQPPIADILASAQGVAFEITNLRNERIIAYSSFIRYVDSTYASNNVVRLTLQDDGSGNPNASGGTNGFYIGMPVKFTGDIGTSGITNDQVYYVNNVVNQTDFTLSTDPSGSPMLSLSNWTVGPAGLECLVGEVTDTAVITVNYPGILNVTATQAVTNKLTVPLNVTGTGGTEGFYIDLPIFFTGTNPNAPQNGVFGGIIENEVYYVTTVVDNQTFTMSETQNPQTFTVTATVASNNTVVINGDTTRLTVNEQIIFNTMQIAGVKSTTFGGITAGATYYVSSIVSPSTFQISTTINGPAVALSDVSAASNTSALVTSQKNTVTLTTDTGNSMVVNVSLPVSPGQVNGQKFTLYQTSEQYPELFGIDGNLITRGVAALIGERIIDGLPVTVNSVVLTNYNPGDTVARGLTNIYVNMPIEISEDLFLDNSLIPGTTYYVVDKGTIEIEVTNTSSSTNELTCDTTEMLFADMPILFSGSGIGGAEIDVEYWVKEVVSDTRFTITNTPGGLELTLTTASGLMTGTGLPYIKVAQTQGGPAEFPGNTQQSASISAANPAVITVDQSPENGNTVIFRNGVVPAGISLNTTYYVRNTSSTQFNISLTPTSALIDTSSGSPSISSTMVLTTETTVDQTPLTVPEFDVSYILGGYRILIANSGTGYAIDNTITIPGTDMGGTAPLNNLTLTVNAIGDDGEITSMIANGIVPGQSNQYYLKVISPTEFELYQNQLMTVPVSGLNLPYSGIAESTVTYLTSGSDSLTLADASEFNVNDAVVFTGDMTPTVGALIEGQTYYITDISGNDITVSEIPAGADVDITTSIAANFTIAKSGSFALLPEPFIFNQSIVKYNNRVYVCVISNNDKEFVFGKWELLTSGDRRLNAMDRVIGYYEPTDNMPGKDLSQLFEGVIYPNSTYLGNAFAPEDQYPIDTVLQDQEFYPTAVDINAVVWDGTRYLAAADTTTYSSIISSLTGEEWDIQKIANTPINTTDMIYAGGYYLMTANNPATPIYRSADGITWTTNGYYTPYGSVPYDTTSYDFTALNISALNLNSVGYKNEIWVSAGDGIVSSDDTYIWRQRFTFSNPLLTNVLYGVNGVTVSSFDGLIAVGKGQQLDYSTGVGITIDVNVIVISTDGINWNQLSAVSSKGFYGVTSNGTNIITVGEDGVIYISNNGANWLGVNEVTVISANPSSNQLNVTSTAGFSVGDQVEFSTSFNVFTAGTTYYVVNVVSSTQLQLSTTLSGSPVTLNGNEPSTTTYMFALRTPSLADVHYANGAFVAVGDSGYIKVSSDGGYTWAQHTSTTSENLKGVTYNEDDGVWIVVGNNNTILTSINNGITWVSSSVFAPQTTVYDVQGAEFTYGYGPEELVPGVVTDNITMTVATRPGTNWDETIYAHVGYNVVSVEYTPESGTQTQYSFDIGNLYDIQTPAQIAVYIIDGSTSLGTAIYETLDYTINWINFTLTLNSPLVFSPVADKLRIDVYEVGNGNQLVKANTKTDPIRINTSTGWNEIYVNCNYSGQIFDGSGVIRPDSNPVDVNATETDSTNNSILCESVKDFTLNSPITFQGSVFGGVSEDTTYYVKTISYTTNRITISTTINVITGTAGSTLALTTGTGSMNVIIKVGYGAVWTDPVIYHNGNKLLIGTTSTVTRTKASNNAITTNTTGGMIVGDRVVFSDTMFGGILLPQTTYYVEAIVDSNEFTVSATLGGPVIILSDATGGAEFITNDYAFGIAPNGISASIIFATGSYDNTVDYIAYTLFGETTPQQYGYTIPEVQVIEADGGTVYDLDNYVGDSNPENAIVEVNGLRLLGTAYTINSNTNEITFVAAPTLGDTIAVTTFNNTDRQYLSTQTGATRITGVTVANIVDVNNNITPTSAITNCTASNGTTEVITCVSTTGFVPGQTIQFKGVTSFGDIAIDGTVYYVRAVLSPTTFTIQDENGTIINLSTGTGLVIAYVGGQSAVRVTTGIAHNLSSGDVVRIDGTLGSIQLNNNTYYVHVISSTQVDLYIDAPYNPGLSAINNPVTAVSSYISGGYIWESTAYVIKNLEVTDTTNSPILGNYLTVASTETLIAGTPIVFTGTVFGGISTNTTYYIISIISATEFSISETRNGSEVILSTDSGSMYVTQWEQTNVDRLWITVNGYRVPSSSLRVNANNEISILIVIVPADEVIITSMMPSATPNEEVFLINVNQTGTGVVYRANTQTRTWLVEPLSNTDTVMHVNDVTRLTDVVTQTETTPAIEDGYYYIGLEADKRLISNVTVYNVTTGQFIDGSNFTIVIENLSPVLKITAGSYIASGNQLNITILEGNLIYVNGEQIKFSSVDLLNNTISGLQRGTNGTGAQFYVPLYAEVYGLLSNNQMTSVDYQETWNSAVYNTTEGDPLQISVSEPATFLRGDIN
jgi:hypothetical protein